MKSAPREPQLISEPLGGPPLARLAQDGAVPAEWYAPRPASGDDWLARATEVRDTARGGWWETIRAACEPAGEALDRVTRVVAGGGVVVTTGQQPGLFGGPVYTWSKALSALAMADEIESRTGIPTVAVFWAATDDSDFAEAASTWITRPGGADRLSLPPRTDDGVRLANVPLDGLEPLLGALERAGGSGADPRPIELVRAAYASGGTVGSAYVTLLRELLHPLGIVVLDAAHRAVTSAAHPILLRALESHSRIAQSLRARAANLRERGFEPQVADVDGRTLVFENAAHRRVRVTFDNASVVAKGASPGDLSPNVLLRPIVERALLPTTGYMAGPGELAYFAQVSAVADAMELPQPLALPRWSVTILEPQIADLLERYGLRVADFADPHAVESRFARATWPAALGSAYKDLCEALAREAEKLREVVREPGLDVVPPEVIDGTERGLSWRLGRLERRINAAMKRRNNALMTELGTLRGALYPGGVRQERALNLIPILARHGMQMLDRMRQGARVHASALVRGESSSPAGR